MAVIKSLLASLMLVASTVAAFSVVPPQTNRHDTVLFVQHGNLGQMALATDHGAAILQGGSDVEWSVGGDWPEECDVDDPNCVHIIEPENDIVGSKNGALLNSSPLGPYHRVQGGEINDWSQRHYSYYYK